MTWVWLILIVIALIIDFLTSDFLFSGFALGAFIALILNVIEVPLVAQIIIFGIVGVVFIFTVYPIIKKKISKDNLGTKVMEQNYIGRTLTLDKDLNDEALIKFEGIYWTFKSLDGYIQATSQVKIIEIQGNKLIIKKI